MLQPPQCTKLNVFFSATKKNFSTKQTKATMPDRERRSHNKKKRRHGRSSPNTGKSPRRLRSGEELRCDKGGVTLSFAAYQIPKEKCEKRYLADDTHSIKFDQNGVDPADMQAVKEKAQQIVPIDSKSMVITWVFLQELELFIPPDDLTRYIISVDRVQGCRAEPVLRFQVPVTCVSNDCDVHVEKSQLTGTTQPFRVQLCAGDALVVGIAMILAEKCTPKACGQAGMSPATQEVAINLETIRVNLFLF
jgi:hypothetical protein